MDDSQRTDHQVALRPVTLDDAAFIFQLRSSSAAQKSLNRGAASEQEQRKWIEDYLIRQSRGLEHYFIILHRKRPMGTVRIYKIDAAAGSFKWGSWAIVPQASPIVSWVSALQVYEYAFGLLGLSVATFEVAVGNSNVLRFHMSFGAIKIAESQSEINLSLSKAQFQATRDSFLRKIGAFDAYNKQ